MLAAGRAADPRRAHGYLAISARKAARPQPAGLPACVMVSRRVYSARPEPRPSGPPAAVQIADPVAIGDRQGRQLAGVAPPGPRLRSRAFARRATVKCRRNNPVAHPLLPESAVTREFAPGRASDGCAATCAPRPHGQSRPERSRSTDHVDQPLHHRRHRRHPTRLHGRDSRRRPRDPRAPRPPRSALCIRLKTLRTLPADSITRMPAIIACGSRRKRRWGVTRPGRTAR